MNTGRIRDMFALVILLLVVFVVIKSFVGEAEIACRGQFISWWSIRSFRSNFVKGVMVGSVKG